MSDAEEGPGGSPPPPYFNFLDTSNPAPLPYLRIWMTATTPYLKVWIRHLVVNGEILHANFISFVK